MMLHNRLRASISGSRVAYIKLHDVVYACTLIMASITVLFGVYYGTIGGACTGLVLGVLRQSTWNLYVAAIVAVPTAALFAWLAMPRELPRQLALRLHLRPASAPSHRDPLDFLLPATVAAACVAWLLAQQAAYVSVWLARAAYVLWLDRLAHEMQARAGSL